jgi:hypothetical protein
MTAALLELVVREDDEDPERYYLRIQFMNDCALELSLPKTKDGYGPDVLVTIGGSSGFLDEYPLEHFRQWLEVALGKRDHMRWLDCACCGRDHRGPMLQDQIWKRLADEGERILCVDCMQERARQRLGRSLTPADLSGVGG